VLRTLIAPLAFGLVVAGCGSTADNDDAAAGADAEDSEADASGDAPEQQDFGDEVTLTFGHPFPPTDPIQVTVWEPWIEEVREATGGTVNIEIHAGGALAPAPQVYENTAAGAQDLGWTMPGYTPGRFPISQIIEAPFVFPNAPDATEHAWQLWDEFPDFQEEFNDVHVLSLWAMDTGDLFTRDRPVERLEDFAGLTIRSPAPLQSQALEAMGASAVSLPGPEIHDSVERGVIDGYKLANSATRVFDLGPSTGYRTACNCYTGAFVLVMNQGSWDRLSPAQQEAISGLSGPELGMRLAERHQSAADEVADEYWPEHGVETVDLSDEELDRWRDAVQPVFDQWVDEREADGVPGRQMADRLFELAGL
jgi:TRAP-type C4-dicarboxylate transport system substrate-binding protein